jgi:hypothetical protein
LVMGALAILLQEIGLNLGWVYLFMGVVIGSAVAPLWNLMTWTKASGTGAVVAAWSGFILALIGWLVGAQIQSGEITVASLGTNEVMLAGNLIAILSSAFIHFVWSMFIDPQDYDFATLDSKITLVEQDLRGLSDEEKDLHILNKADRWIKRRGYVLSLVLIIIWPLLSVPAGLFSRSYFAFWVLVSIAWGFGAALVITVLPFVESADEINMFLGGIWYYLTGKTPPERPDLTTQEVAEKVVEEDVPAKEIETPPAETPAEVEEA